jgi:Mg2+-importing ATPase
MESFLHSFWNVPAPELLKQLQTTTQGLSEEEVQERLARHGSNLFKPKKEGR